MWQSRYASVLRSECHLEPPCSLQTDCKMGSVVARNPSMWQLVIAKHAAHALTTLQCVLLCSSCVVSVDAFTDRLDLPRAKDGWQCVELSYGKVFSTMVLPYSKTGFPVQIPSACFNCFEVQPLCLTTTIIIMNNYDNNHNTKTAFQLMMSQVCAGQVWSLHRLCSCALKHLCTPGCDCNENMPSTIVQARPLAAAVDETMLVHNIWY